MTVVKEFIDAIAWLHGVMLAFLRTARVPTSMLVVVQVLERIFKLVAFLLPLKVIILAGSDGVPRYFQAFIDPAHKDPWIGILAGGALVSYAAYLAMAAWGSRLSRRGSAMIAARAIGLSVIRNQVEQAKGHYENVTYIYSCLAFAVVAFVVMPVIDLNLFLFLTIFLVLLAGLTFLAIRDRRSTSPMARLIRENTNTYLTILSSITYLTAFLVILAPYLMGQDRNILLSIISVVLVRHLLSSLSAALRTAIKVVDERQTVSALTFKRHHAKKPVDGEEEDSVVGLFAKPERQLSVKAALAAAGVPLEQLDVHWADAPNTQALLLTLSDSAWRTPRPGAPQGFAQLQGFTPRRINNLENETLLFQHVAREALGAPPVFARFSHGRYQCQIVDYGSGRTVLPRDWRAVQSQLLLGHWAVVPPESLVGLYRRSAPLLRRKLNADLLDQLAVGADTGDEAQTLADLRQALPQLRRRIAALPLYVANRDFDTDHVVERVDGGYYVTSWGRWTLEPVGAHLPRDFDDDPADLASAFAALRASRGDVPDEMTAEDLLLAQAAAAFETAVSRQKFKAGFVIAERLLSHLGAGGQRRIAAE